VTRRRLLATCLLACSAYAAAESPERFAWSVPIEIDPAQPLQQIEIPQSVYEGTARADLSDLRVFNGTGEPVPYALVPRAAPGTAAPPAHSLKLFPLHAARGVSADSLSVRVQHGPEGVVVSVTSTEQPAPALREAVGYLVDASPLELPIRTLELRWRESGSFSGRLRVEGSDDLARWTTLADGAPLVSLEFAGQRLEHRTIDLRAARYKYLRLSWPPGQTAITLTELVARPGARHLEPARRWKAAQGSAGEEPGEYLFDLAGWFPIDRMRIELPQPNTLVSVQLAARNGADQPWHPVGGGVQYRLQRDGQDLASPDLRAQGRAWRYWRLRVDQKGGGLGAGAPRLHAGWVPQEMVFVARGAPPFQLAYGQLQAQPGAYPIETIVPGWRTDTELKAATARTGEQRALAGPAALRPPPDIKTWTLWGSLALAVAVLAWMAWRLAGDLRRGA
jgi:hypothetical protein